MAELTAELLGIDPLLFDTFKNVVFTKRSTTQISVRSRVVKPSILEPPRLVTTFSFASPLIKGQGAYALNLISGAIHDQGLEFVGQDENGVFHFFKEEKTFTFNGQTHTIDANWVTIEPDNGSWKYVFKDANNVRASNNKAYTVDFLAEKMGIEPEDFFNQYEDYLIGAERDPNTHITSIVCDISRDENGLLHNNTLFNGEYWKDWARAGKITSFDKINAGYRFKWYEYKGEDGELIDNGKMEAIPWSDPRALTYSPKPDTRYVKLMVAEWPDQGKNEGDETYWDIERGYSPKHLPKKNVETGEITLG